MRKLLLILLIASLNGYGQSPMRALIAKRVTGSSDTGLLVTYSGASAAYSVRLLTTAYVGNCIRVRESSGNTESDIGFVNGVLDTATLKTFVGANDGFIVRWYDQSGNGNNAVNTTTAQQPQIISSGTVLRLNGQPCIEINGVNERLVFTTISTIISVFMVYNSAATNDAYPPILGDGTASDFHGQNSNTLMYNTSFASANIVNGTHYINNTNYTTANVPKSTSQQLYALTTNGNVTASNIANDRLSFGRSWLGKFQEVIIYTSSQSSNRTGIQTNINNFYAAY